MKVRPLVAALMIAVFALMAFMPLAKADRPGMDDSCAMRCPMPGMMGMAGKTGKDAGAGSMFYNKAYMILANAKELGLSESQAASIKSKKLALKKALIQKQADVKMIAADMAAMTYGGDIDTQAMSKLIDKKYAVKAQMAKDVLAACDEVKNILTPEQRGKLKEMIAAGHSHKMTDKMKGRMGRMMMPQQMDDESEDSE